MARENSHQIRQLIAQQAARMMAEEGISDYAYAKKKAGKKLGTSETSHLPTNSEIAEEVKIYQELFFRDEQPEQLKLLRHDALVTMQMLERFNPHLTGSVLDGTAGRYADTHLHLFADSLKEVEMFLLNKKIHFQTNEKSYRKLNDGKRDKKSSNRKTVPVFILEGPNGLIKLSVFEFDDMRIATKHAIDGANAERLNIARLTALLA
ncbi:MAG: hypothetical protein H7Z18_10325 [Methylophilaceae bacterium]|nr:hypothetical protein [Methylophilaceae bacterium]